MTEQPEQPGQPEAAEPAPRPAGGPTPDSPGRADPQPVDPLPTDEGDDFEGPRRRARQERVERRAAEQRAMAIEQARREAKRRLRGAGVAEPKPVSRGAVRGLRVLMWGALAAVVTVGLGLLLYFTPVMSARSIEITGIAAVTAPEVLDAANVQPGTPLLQINTDQVADRVANIRRVASVRVQRQYPSTLRITIAERVPVAVKDFPDGPHLYDRDGVDFATGPPPPSLPHLDVAAPGPTDSATTAALDVLTALRPEVVALVGQIAAPSVASITLTLVDGRVVVWGTADRTQEKADTLAALLTQPGQVYDVSSPDLSTVK